MGRKVRIRCFLGAYIDSEVDAAEEGWGDLDDQEIALQGVESMLGLRMLEADAGTLLHGAGLVVVAAGDHTAAATINHLGNPLARCELIGRADLVEAMALDRLEIQTLRALAVGGDTAAIVGALSEVAKGLSFDSCTVVPRYPPMLPGADLRADKGDRGVVVAAAPGRWYVTLLNQGGPVAYRTWTPGDDNGRGIGTWGISTYLGGGEIPEEYRLP